MIDEKEIKRREIFGSKLKKFRNSMGLKQVEVAKRLGISPTTYMHYEQGKREPSIKNLIKIAEELAVSIDDLLRDEKTEVEFAVNKWESYGCKVIFRDNDINKGIAVTLPEMCKFVRLDSIEFLSPKVFLENTRFLEQESFKFAVNAFRNYAITNSPCELKDFKDIIKIPLSQAQRPSL